MSERCVGAYLRPCVNLTDTVLCAACYDFVARTTPTQARRAAACTRRVYRRRHAKAAA